MSDSLKILTTLHQLGSYGSEGHVKHKSFAEACNFIRTQCILNKHTYRNLKYKVNETTAVVEHDQQGRQVNNLRSIPLESWKILPDKAREIWLNMRLQEKETINGMPKLLWEKLDENDRKEYLEK